VALEQLDPEGTAMYDVMVNTRLLWNQAPPSVPSAVPPLQQHHRVQGPEPADHEEAIGGGCPLGESPVTEISPISFMLRRDLLDQAASWEVREEDIGSEGLDRRASS
jgi:hypothetical protein